MFGVVRHRERLPFRLEAGDDGLRVHPGFDELERDESLHGFDLLSHPDRTHAAFADGLEELVFPGDDGSGFDGVRGAFFKRQAKRPLTRFADAFASASRTLPLREWVCLTS